MKTSVPSNNDERPSNIQLPLITARGSQKQPHQTRTAAVLMRYQRSKPEGQNMLDGPRTTQL
eukprot:14147984-Alexandrium_andersonii.AAC.1